MLTRLPYIINSNIVHDCIDACYSIQEKTVLNKPSGDFFYDPWLLKNDYVGTCWEKLLESLPHSIGEARVIRLLPGESYMAHADIDNRWHFNLTGEHSYLIDLDEKQMHLLEKDCQWYSMDASKIHVATNFGSTHRWQVVIRQLLKRSNRNDLVSVTIKPNGLQHDYRYKFDKIISPFLNKVDKEYMLSDFKFDKEIISFKLADNRLDALKNILTQDFEITYA